MAPSQCIIISIIACITAITVTTAIKPTYYWKNRQLECLDHGINISRCVLREQNRTTELNPGCFDEVASSNETRIYCRLYCEESDEATVLQKLPAWNHACNTGFTYHLERRRMDWCLWRSGDCVSTTITFRVRCGFPSNPRIFYAQNRHLLDYEDFNTTTTPI